jgi:hypothetical protein
VGGEGALQGLPDVWSVLRAVTASAIHHSSLWCDLHLSFGSTVSQPFEAVAAAVGVVRHHVCYQACWLTKQLSGWVGIMCKDRALLAVWCAAGCQQQATALPM